MPEPGTTALVIAVPAAEPLLDAAKRVNPALVRPGLIAHVTALYPFLPDRELSGDVEQAVRELAATLPRTRVRLTEVVITPGFAAAPAPDLQPVADAVCDRWPEVLPYGGRFGPRPGAHVTVAMGGTGAELARVAEEATALLPVSEDVEELQLVALTDQGWQVRLTAPFGSAAGTTAR